MAFHTIHASLLLRRESSIRRAGCWVVDCRSRRSQDHRADRYTFDERAGCDACAQKPERVLGHARRSRGFVHRAANARGLSTPLAQWLLHLTHRYGWKKAKSRYMLRTTVDSFVSPPAYPQLTRRPRSRPACPGFDEPPHQRTGARNW